MYRPRGLHWSALLELVAHRHRIQAGEMPHVFLCLADHYEPMHGQVPAWKQQERVRRWREEYPKLTAGLADSRGKPPQHTFFWPADEYTPEHVAQIAELCEQGFGDVEIDLHHDNDTAEGLRETLEWFKAELHNEHGLLRPNAEGRLEYGFIHGNWALDNSRADGRWCGVNNELTVLRETGCYADFTMPSAPSETQTRTINSIYYAFDDPHRPKSHDVGSKARVGQAPPEEALLMVQGPLALDWSRKKHGFLPRLENGDLHGLQPPTAKRLEFWMRRAFMWRGNRIGCSSSCTRTEPSKKTRACCSANRCGGSTNRSPCRGIRGASLPLLLRHRPRDGGLHPSSRTRREAAQFPSPAAAKPSIRLLRCFLIKCKTASFRVVPIQHCKRISPSMNP